MEDGAAIEAGKRRRTWSVASPPAGPKTSSRLAKALPITSSRHAIQHALPAAAALFSSASCHLPRCPVASSSLPAAVCCPGLLVVLRTAGWQVECSPSQECQRRCLRRPTSHTSSGPSSPGDGPGALHHVAVQPRIAALPPQRHARRQQAHRLPPRAVPTVRLPRGPDPEHLQAVSLGGLGPLAKLQG